MLIFIHITINILGIIMMRNRWREKLSKTLMFFLLVGLQISLIVLFASPLRAAEVEVEDEFILVAPTSGTYIAPLLEEFESWALTNYGVEISTSHLRPGSSEEAVRQIQDWDQEPEADVFFSARTPYFTILQEEWLLETYKGGKVMDWWEDIPETAFEVQAKDPDGYWIAFAMSGFGIMVNSEKLQTEGLMIPTSWSDLATPEYHGHVAFGNPSTTGIAHMILENILQIYGWEEGWKLFLKIARNIDVFTRATGTAVKLCAEGDYAIALTKDSDWYTKKADYPVDWVWPSDGMGVVPIGLALLKGAPHLETGKLFIDFVMSGVGMKLWAEIRSERPIRSDVEIPTDMPPLEEI